MLYMDIFGDIRFGPHWMSLWKAHNEGASMRAKPEVTQRIGLGGPDEDVVRPHDSRQAWTLKVSLYYDLPCAIPGILRAKGREYGEISQPVGSKGNF
jgi:hypothetical protein